MRWHWIGGITLFFAGALAAAATGRAGEADAPMKAGIIGLDAHALAWTRIINDPKATGALAEMTVVAG